MIGADELLVKLVLGWLPLDKFEAAYLDDVGDPADEICQRFVRAPIPKRGVCCLFVLRGGLTVVEDAKGRWAVYESQARVDEREYLSTWGEFVRGCWLSSIPVEPGVYPTRDLEGRKGKDRELRLVQGRLKDCTYGFVGAGKVTEWRGEWWSRKLPNLRGAV